MHAIWRGCIGKFFPRLVAKYNLACIKFQAVSFGYDADKPLLSSFSCLLQAGDRVALTGPSGAGESTFVKPLLGQLIPQAGAVQINGQNLQQLEPATWFSRVAYVAQTPFLFEGSVLENICFEQACDVNQISQALHLSCVDAFLTLERACSAPVVAEGSNYSGGERQRLALARAVIKAADVIILDESASALDAHTEKLVAQRLAQYMDQHPQKILLAITHRPQLQAFCNKNMRLLGDGRIVLE